MEWAGIAGDIIGFKLKYAVFLAGATSISTILSSFIKTGELQKFLAEVFEDDVEADSAIEILYETLRGR